MLGTVREVGGTFLVQFERHYGHPIAQVWAAVTEPSGLAGWLAAASVEQQVGGRVALRWLNVREGDPELVARGTVTAYDPPRLVEYETDLHGRLRFELEPEGEGCRLRFTCTIAMPAEHVWRNVSGWHIHLEHLAGALEGRPVDWPRWWEEHFPRWQEIYKQYESGQK